MSRSVRIAAIVLFLAGRAAADPAVAWKPVTPKDWAASPDSSADARGAVMLFEHVESNEKELEDEKCALKVYRRIRIFNAVGRSQGDVRIAYRPDDEEVTLVGARAYQPDGAFVELAATEVHDQEKVKNEDFTLREKFFAVPGITDNCIVDYSYEMKRKRAMFIWPAQKDIPLREFRYRWIPSPPKQRRESFGLWTITLPGAYPNYFWMNSNTKLHLDQYPSAQEPEEAVFGVADLPAFRHEPHAPPDGGLKASLLLYYSPINDPGSYWALNGDWAGDWVKGFIESDGGLDDVVKNFAALPSPAEKITAAYRWIQENITNVSYDRSGKSFDDIRDAGGVLDHRYGTQEDINLLFHAMLKKLGIESYIVLPSNRDVLPFYVDAKVQQFHRTLVAVRDAAGKVSYYSPGDAFEAPGFIPWYYEHSVGLIAGAESGQHIFADLPRSSCDVNVERRTLRLRLGAGEELHGVLDESLSGHPGREFRLKLKDAGAAGRNEAARKELTSSLAGDWQDSLTVLDVAERGDSALLSASILAPPPESNAAGQIVVHALGGFADTVTSFESESRRYPVVMPWGGTILQNTELVIGKEYGVVSLPQEVQYDNYIGSVDVSASVSGDTVRVASRFVLRRPDSTPENYFAVRALFGRRLALKDAAVVLKRKR